MGQMDLARRIVDWCKFIPTNVLFFFFSFLERNVIDATVVCVCAPSVYMLQLFPPSH